MLIIPISGKIGWRNPPLITLVILLINCLVYFLFQTHDDAARMAAEEFYLDSGLMAIELPYYRDYLEATGKADDEALAADPADTEAMMRLHFALETDADFLRRLKNGRVITPQNAEYENWRGLRQEYERKCNRSVAYAHGLRPAASRVSAFFTYMFLHGSVGHLVGNMVFLWILGCMIEIGAGRLLFTGIYLISGLMAGGLFCLVYPSSMVPLVGASGAIAGLMGAYTVLYGRTRVSVFYSLGFYFNTARIPAIVLLPAWIANECYQLFFSGASHVAYVAHIGGLAGGALLAYAGDRLVGKVDRDSFAETAEDKIAPLMHQALEHVAKLEMRPAQALFEEILELSPDHPEALSHLFNLHKLSPDSPAFHDVTKRLLQLYGKTPATHAAAISSMAPIPVSRNGRPCPFRFTCRWPGSWPLPVKPGPRKKYCWPS
ncbi:rhomboid family intramembrane serine protease [Desulfosarcina cetonica]|uniref:rhomboid family intramembrane serine protease n=1 Tax=Desulfosarcina cetonica TaxID=90730 RepID=UPI0006D127E0|nr:rhomboid family intramembrane serine protease [Desulfosarcina cetonica]